MAICICKSRRNPFCAAHIGYVNKCSRVLTAKQCVLLADPKATLDYSEVMRSHAKPCYFIRHGLQGEFLHAGLFSTPRAAWHAAYLELRSQIRATAERRLRDA